MGETVDIERGRIYVLQMPYSEAAMAMHLAGKRCRVLILEGKTTFCQLINDFGIPVSGALTIGEVGIYRRSDGTMYAHGAEPYTY